MVKTFTAAFLFIGFFQLTIAQGYSVDADSIRRVYHIPELAYAVISSDTIYEMQVLGFKRVDANVAAETDDRFRIGSNTKAVTGLIAALLVKQDKIKWDTRFFDLFPELKKGSRKVYHSLTLLHLLTFRTKLFPYTYTYSKPDTNQFAGNEDEQRYEFARWFFKHKPRVTDDSINFSNLGYVAAELMLEKASGKSYKQMVLDFGRQFAINFDFGAPNSTDSLQPWGHNAQLQPEPPGDNRKLNWLLAAGNINVDLPSYVKFIQLQLKGLLGKGALLSKEEWFFLHRGLARFAVGWFSAIDEMGRPYSYNIGNPGTFLSAVYVHHQSNLAFVIFTNAQTPEAQKGIDLLYANLKKRYMR